MQLYKFTTISPRSIASISSGKFFAATLARMNDPFEDRFKSATGSLRTIVDACGVFCVSRSVGGPNDVLTNPLMWAHYSANHAGIAIGLRASPDHTAFTEVEYLAQDALDAQVASLQEQYANRTHAGTQSLIKLAFKFKHDFWAYENEYRRVVVGPNRYVDPLAEINEIVFGFRSRPEEELAVWCALRENVQYRKMTNVGGSLSVIDYAPVTDIKVVGEESLVVPDASDAALEDAQHATPHELVPKVTFVKDA